MSGVTPSRLLPLLAMLAMLFAPFGRMGSAEAMAAPAHHIGAGAAHCPEMPVPDEQNSGPAAIDCAIACAVVAPPVAPALAPAPRLVQPQAVSFLATFSGLNPAADPPPPRLS